MRSTPSVDNLYDQATPFHYQYLSFKYPVIRQMCRDWIRVSC